MKDRVSQFLLEQGHIDREQYDKARRTKEFFGGPLDAHLLKLGFIQETTLGSALSAMTGFPYAGPGQLRIVDPMVAARLPVEMVEQHRVCPFEVSDGVLRLAMLNPRDAVALARVESCTGLTAEPWVTSEYRLNLALERHYRVPQRHYRALSLGPESTLERELSRAEEGTPLPDREPGEESWDGDVGLDGRPLDAELTADQFALVDKTGTPDDEPATSPETAAAPPQKDPDGLREVGRKLAAADTVEAVNACLLDYCSGKVSRSAVFTLSGDSYRCSAGRGRSMTPGRTGHIAIPAGAGHLLDQFLDSGKSFYLGPVPPLPANRDLYSLLGGSLPPAAMILPLKVLTRVVALLYLDNDTDAIDDPDIPSMHRLAAKAGLAFELILLRRKLVEL